MINFKLLIPYASQMRNEHTYKLSLTPNVENNFKNIRGSEFRLAAFL